MTSIYFEKTKHAYLPEIEAYRAYLAAHHPKVRVVDDADGADIVWRFMGGDRRPRKAGQYLVHEYNSLSTGLLAPVKNAVKKYTNVRPDRRVFLNTRVARDFGFNDGVPQYFRDMGIDPQFFSAPVSRDFDFIYVGSLDRGRIIPDFLDYFAAEMTGFTLLLVGAADPALRDRYHAAPHVVFEGRVPYKDIPSYLARARFGLNLMPDRYPYNVQTSTKLLEYCAGGLEIVSSRYAWAEAFAAERAAGFFWLERDFANLSREQLTDFDFKTPGVNDLTWDEVIGQSGIFDFLA